MKWCPSRITPPQISYYAIYWAVQEFVTKGLDMLAQHPVFRVFVILGIFIGVILVLPVKIPFTISTHGQIFHGKEWIVSKDESGRISAVLYDRIDGRTENYRLYQFDRQDAVRFELNNSVIPGNYIQAGDTVGIIYSTQLSREYVALVGDLEVTRASLDLHGSGEKEAVVEEARNRLAYAKQQLRGHTILLERQRELYKRNLISDEELDIAVQQKRLYEIDIQIAEAQLQAALSGAKDEQIEFLNTRIATLEEEISSFERIIEEYTYLSPIDGIVYHTFSHDTLALIGNTETYIAVIPVPFQYRQYIANDQKVKLRIPGNNIAARYGKVHSIGNTVRLINGGQFFMISALVENLDDEYLPGILASASVQTESVTIREYLLRYTRPIFN